MPRGGSIHREFRLADDMFAQDSIELLKLSGINFAETEARGIDVHSFGELLMSSGIVLNEEVRMTSVAERCSNVRSRALLDDVSVRDRAAAHVAGMCIKTKTLQNLIKFHVHLHLCRPLCWEAAKQRLPCGAFDNAPPQARSVELLPHDAGAMDHVSQRL